MAYRLAGREAYTRLGAMVGHCIFCDELIAHVNDGGRGWALGSLVGGEAKQFLYCHHPACEAKRQNAADIWRCYCTSPDGAAYVENVGTHCHACHSPREQSERFAAAYEQGQSGPSLRQRQRQELPDAIGAAVRQAAKDQYNGNDDIAVDDDAVVSVAQDGFWVQAWVWLPRATTPRGST